MKFGDIVILTRGSRGRQSGPGREREILARYLGAKGCMVYCELLADDQFATVPPFKAGERGWWHGRSFIQAMTEDD